MPRTTHSPWILLDQGEGLARRPQMIMKIKCEWAQLVNSIADLVDDRADWSYRKHISFDMWLRQPP